MGEFFAGEAGGRRVKDKVLENCGPYSSIYEYRKSNKREARHKKGVCRTYEAPDIYMVVARQRLWAPFNKLFYRSWFVVKGRSLVARAQFIGEIAFKQSNKAICGDVEGSDTSFRECHARRAEAIRDEIFNSPANMLMRDASSRVRTRAKGVRAAAVGLHPSGEAGNWSENTSNYGPIYIGGVKVLLGIDMYKQPNTARGMFEGDDSILISKTFDVEAAVNIRRWVLANGFISEQTFCRVVINAPGPPAVADFCSTLIGMGPHSWLTAPVQPRGVCRLLGTATNPKSFNSLLAAKCASALCLCPTGGVHVSTAQMLAMRLDPRTRFTEEMLERHGFDNPAVTTGEIVAAWRVLGECDHSAHEWNFEATVWWNVRPASWLQTFCNDGFGFSKNSHFGSSFESDQSNWWSNLSSLLDDAMAASKRKDQR
jgi:hypothetical protein